MVSYGIFNLIPLTNISLNSDVSFANDKDRNVIAQNNIRRPINEIRDYNLKKNQGIVQEECLT